MGQVRAATIGDLDMLAEVAAAGFYDDPVMRWVAPDADRRPRQLAFLFGGLARDMLSVAGAVQVAEDASVAFWRPPDLEHGRVDRVQEPDEVAAWAARFAPDELERLGVLGAAVIAAHPREPHWYLNVLSTLPTRQGQGLGTAVLQPILEICDADGVRAYLESSNPRNLTLYRRHGFVDSGEIELPGGPSLYPMWREPRT